MSLKGKDILAEKRDKVQERFRKHLEWVKLQKSILKNAIVKYEKKLKGFGSIERKLRNMSIEAWEKEYGMDFSGVTYRKIEEMDL